MQIFKFLRVRVKIDILKPLRIGAKVRVGSSGPLIWVDFKYEKIPDFCFYCGRVGHSVNYCPEEGSEVMLQKGQFQYREWLRGSSSNKLFSKDITTGRKGNKGLRSLGLGELPEHAGKEIGAAELTGEKTTQLVAASTSRVLSNNSAANEDDKTDRNTTNLSARPGSLQIQIQNWRHGDKCPPVEVNIPD
ncbi:Zinc knuckle CX2CX4HX4C [Trema orientale]|uniref:Zinc knuckle CX2CX4HX4C n=1 Tax=Trema orientale TaxID=63057 RepID=A0A2P5EHV3_TREOI|nr:Zinc knuckle CX2CX4HX4C [Trema orientale]